MIAGLLSNFRNTFIVGLVLAGVMIWAYSQGPQGTGEVFFVRSEERRGGKECA